MHGIQEYLERRSTQKLKGMLVAYCEGYADFGVETAMKICVVISQRDPKYLDPKEEFIRICRLYLI